MLPMSLAKGEKAGKTSSKAGAFSDTYASQERLVRHRDDVLKRVNRSTADVPVVMDQVLVFEIKERRAGSGRHSAAAQIARKGEWDI